MATAELQQENGNGEVVITSEAMDSLECFSDGLDELVYNVAEAAAKQRSHSLGHHQVEITRDDIREACRAIIDSLAQSKFPEPAKSLIEGLRERLKEAMSNQQ